MQRYAGVVLAMVVCLFVCLSQAVVGAYSDKQLQLIIRMEAFFHLSCVVHSSLPTAYNSTDQRFTRTDNVDLIER